MYALKGNLIWTEESGCFRVLENGYLLINDGCIAAVSSEPFAGVRTEDFGSRLIIPGLYDLHIHAPQYMFAGLFMDDELLVWLDKHTFPLEARFSDIIFAEKAYRAFVNDLKYSFTARASVFGTIHKDSTLFLMSLMEEAGLHGYVGKVSMDRNSPDSLRETTADAIEDELGFLDKAPEYRNVKPIVTPRFIPSCTDELLLALGKVAKERDLAAVQNSPADYVLLDSGAGTGRVFDWQLIQKVSRPYFLAGGLTPGNVAESIRLLHPYAVDVSSGIETGGIKDNIKMASAQRLNE